MKLLAALVLAALAGGCVISTELDPPAMRKVKNRQSGTGTNIMRHDVRDLLGEGLRAMGPDEVEKLKRTGGSRPRGGDGP